MTDATYGTAVYNKQGGAELVIASGGTLTVESGATVDMSGLTAGTPGVGFSGGTGTVIKSSVEKIGGIIRTSFLIDLTGLGSSTTDLDIIGTGASAAYFGRITAALNGTILSGRMICLEVPVGGVTDIDIYSATEATGVFDAGIGTLAETAILTSGAAWTLALTRAIGAVPAANEYLYLTCGAAGTPAAYTAGKFLIVFEGY